MTTRQQGATFKVRLYKDTPSSMKKCPYMRNVFSRRGGGIYYYFAISLHLKSLILAW